MSKEKKNKKTLATCYNGRVHSLFRTAALNSIGTAPMGDDFGSAMGAATTGTTADQGRLVRVLFVLCLA